ncbi:hypothetical protein BBP40_002592 [Aspergillus hancockii]|nr:hypothetical protein BBP40_002592 [Aspergillus hancockii]
MLQHGGTYVFTARKGLLMLHNGSYEEDRPPTEDCDLSGQSMPIPVQFARDVFGTKAISAVDREMLEGPAKVGFKVDYGEDGSCIDRKYITCEDGYYIDVGCNHLIIDGKVKVRSSPGGIKSFSPSRVILTDGTELTADLVVLATSYQTMHSTARSLFGNLVADRLGKVWDLDEEGDVHSIGPLMHLSYRTFATKKDSS